MKNIQENTKNLKLYNEEGVLTYEFKKDSDGYIWEITYDSKGFELTFKDSDGYSHEYTRDLKGNRRTFKYYDKFCEETAHGLEYTWDSMGNEISCKDSNGVIKIFDFPKQSIIKRLINKLSISKIRL